MRRSSRTSENERLPWRYMAEKMAALMPGGR